MRYPIVLLICFTLFACGKTGALYLPEEPTPEPAQQDEQAPKQETSNDGNAD